MNPSTIPPASEGGGLTVHLGEVMAPGLLVTSLVVAPGGAASLDPGALHGKSQLERTYQPVRKREELVNPLCYRMVWVAVALDQINRPVRYHGVCASALWVDLAQQRYFRSSAESVNRMSQAMRGGVHVSELPVEEREAVGELLARLDPVLWNRSESIAQAFHRAPRGTPAT
jgi:hypothetical protein